MRVRVTLASGFYFDRFGVERPAKLLVLYPVTGEPRVLQAVDARTKEKVGIEFAYLESKITPGE